MIYKEAFTASNRKILPCECINGHKWKEIFYQYLDDDGFLKWEYAYSDGSICPSCGEQDLLDHL